MILFISIAALFLSGCGKEMHPEVARVQAEFIREAQARGVELLPTSITIADSDDGPYEAVCKNKRTPFAVVVLKPFWLEATDSAKELILFHELGHCALGREHTDEFPARSIMNSWGVSAEVFSKSRQAFLDELFTIHADQ